MWGQGGSGCGRWWECVCILHGSGGDGGGEEQGGGGGGGGE